MIVLIIVIKRYIKIIFTGMGDNETIPDIWFELTQETECLEIGAIEGGYVVVLDKEN